MKLKKIWALLLLGAAHAGSAAPAEPQALEPGVAEEIYLAPGRATTVILKTDQKVAAISLASPIVTYRYDKALNQLELTPSVRAGGVETNLNLRIGADVYVLLVKVVNDIRAEFLRAFTLAGDPSASEESQLGSVRPLAPAEIDLVTAARTLDRAEADPVFRKAHPQLRLEALHSERRWNDCTIALDAVGQFLDLDLLVFRIRWVNSTADALYLDPTQYTLCSSGIRIPVQARYSNHSGSVLFPGEEVAVYLAVQGYRLSRHNEWRLALPPDASALPP